MPTKNNFFMKNINYKALFFALIALSFSFTAFKCKSTSQPETTYTKSTSKNLNKSKKEILQSLFGESQLMSISGLMGANTMISIEHTFTPVVDKWTGIASSSAMTGSREAFDMEITAQQVTILNSCRIVVQKDLSVYLTVNNKKILTVPFSENSMFLSLKKPLSEIAYLPSAIDQNTTFVDNYMYLALTDKFDSTFSVLAEIPGVVSDVLLLRYNVETKQFEIVVAGYESIGTATFVFNR